MDFKAPKANALYIQYIEVYNLKDVSVRVGRKMNIGYINGK